MRIRPFDDARDSVRAALVRGIPAAAAGFLAAAPVLASTPEPSLWDAVEIGFETKPGVVYTVQGSKDLKQWWPVRGPVYGTGETVTELVSARSLPEDYGFYRLKAEAAAEGGFAPWKLEGTAFQKCGTAGVEVYSFKDSGKGTVKKQGGAQNAFTWTWLRTGANAGELTVLRENGAREVMKLEYAAENLGRITTGTRGILSGSGEIFSATGTFGPVPSVTETTPPGQPDGRTLIVADDADMERLTFSQASEGLRSLFTNENDPLAAETRAFTCSWTKAGQNVVNLTVRPLAERRVEYELVFHSPLAGTFVRRVFTGDVFRDQDTGAFSLSAKGE